MPSQPSSRKSLSLSIVRLRNEVCIDLDHELYRMACGRGFGGVMGGQWPGRLAAGDGPRRVHQIVDPFAAKSGERPDHPGPLDQQAGQDVTVLRAAGAEDHRETLAFHDMLEAGRERLTGYRRDLLQHGGSTAECVAVLALMASLRLAPLPELRFRRHGQCGEVGEAGSIEAFAAGVP